MRTFFYRLMILVFVAFASGQVFGGQSASAIPSETGVEPVLSTASPGAHPLKQLRSVKKAWNAANKEQNTAGKKPRATDTLLLVILSLFIPPLAVFLYEGDLTNKFWISLVLTLLFFIPGVIYSLLVVTGNI